VLRAFPDVPVNIEIKGRADTNFASFLRNADLLAALLNRLGRSEGLIVASFNDAALTRFHAQAPAIGLAPGIAGTALYRLAGVRPMPGTVAFQVPITFAGFQVTDAAFVSRAQADGYAVHVWLSNDPEDRPTYEQLLSWGVEGIMAARPTDLERLLCERNLPRPASPFATHCAHLASACSVRARSLSRPTRSGALRARLRRSTATGACRGRVALRRGGRTLARARFAFRSGHRTTSPRLRLSRHGRALLRRHARVRVSAAARPGGTSRLMLRRR
jgi:hypothetical protein